jgi:hypothetical protein
MVSLSSEACCSCTGLSEGNMGIPQESFKCWDLTTWKNMRRILRIKVTAKYTECPRRKGHNTGHLSKKVYMYMCPIPNGFRETAILLYSSKTVDKKEILRAVADTGIYCSSDKVGTVYLV